MYHWDEKNPFTYTLIKQILNLKKCIWHKYSEILINDAKSDHSVCY